MRITLICCLLLLTFTFTHAQEATPEPADGWTIEQRCVAEPTTPPDDWTFEGTIFTSDYIFSDEVGGFHAIRADVETPYYVAFNGNDFVRWGALSPDGRWYAVPSGRASQISITEFGYSVDSIHVYSTNPARLRYSVLWDAAYREGLSFELRWLDNESFVYAAGSINAPQNDYYIINPFTETTQLIEGLSVSDIYARYSPDGTRVVRSVEGERMLFSVENEQFTPIRPVSNTNLRWFSDSSHFVTLDENLNLGLFNRDGELLTSIFTNHPFNTSVSSDDQYIAFISRPEAQEATLHIASVTNQLVIDTCLMMNDFTWSSLTQQIAFNLEGQVQIFDIGLWQTYTIATTDSEIIAWRDGWRADD
jgi:hypothetical protein